MSLEVDGSLVKRAGNTLDSCLSDCVADVRCKASSYDSRDGACTYFSCLYQGSAHEANGITFAAVRSREASSGTVAVVVNPFVCDNSTVSSSASATSTQTVVIVTSSINETIPLVSLGSVVAVSTVMPQAQGQATLTRYTTTTYTITACPSTVLNCPASNKSTYLTTKTIVEYLPVDATQTAASKAALSGSGSMSNPQSLVIGYSTSTLYSTSVRTVTACPSTIEDCPASEKAVLYTDVVIAYTTVCPVFATSTAVPEAGVLANGQSNGSPFGSGSGVTPDSDSASTSDSSSDFHFALSSGIDTGSVSDTTSGSGSASNIGPGSIPGETFRTQHRSGSKFTSAVGQSDSNSEPTSSYDQDFAAVSASTAVWTYENNGKLYTISAGSSVISQSQPLSSTPVVGSEGTTTHLAGLNSEAPASSVLISSSEISASIESSISDSSAQATANLKSSPKDTLAISSTAVYSDIPTSASTSSFTLTVSTSSSSLLLPSVMRIAVSVACIIVILLAV